MVKNVTGSGNWWTFDTTRGISSSLSVNEDAQAWNLTIGGQTALADSIVNLTNTFIVVENATTSINASGFRYLWVAWAA